MNATIIHLNSDKFSESLKIYPNAPCPAATRLSLTNFRCYNSLIINPKKGLIVLTGANGAGKTNLLEALSLLNPGRGLRQAQLSEMANESTIYKYESLNNSPHWAVGAEFCTQNGALSIGVGWKKSSNDNRTIRINGSTISSQAMLTQYISMVWLTPAMDRLFLESPAGRRQFLDRLVFAFDPEHAGRLQAYDRARRQRSRLLRENYANASWLDALEQNMTEQAIAIAAARVDLVEQLNISIQNQGGTFPQPIVATRGLIEDWVKKLPALQVEENYASLLTKSRSNDRETGSCEGIHRSDLLAQLCENGPFAEKSSTGEQKAILISLILAHSRLLSSRNGQAPLLLLDEITAHLDASRREALFETLIDIGAQTWMTGTDVSNFSAIKQCAEFYTISNGSISEQNIYV